MAKVVVNRRADIYHNNGNNKVEFEDNLYRILSRNREYVNKLLSGEESYPNISQPIPVGYIYPTRYGTGSWATLMEEPFTTVNSANVEFTQTGKTITMSATPFLGYEKQPCVAVINCDIGNNVGVTLAAKLVGMYGGSYTRDQYWDNIAFTFSAVLNITSSGGGSATLTFTTGKTVTVNSVTVYYKPRIPATVTDTDNVLSPLVMPNVESAGTQTEIKSNWSYNEGSDSYFTSKDDVSTGSGGCILFNLGHGIEFVARGINEDVFTSSSAATTQTFNHISDEMGYTAYTAEITTSGNYYILKVTDEGYPASITLSSIKRVNF